MKLRQASGRSWAKPIAIFLVIAAAYAVWMLSRVHAQSAERMLRLGAELSRSQVEGEARDIELNGARVRVSSGSSLAEVGVILDAAHGACQRSGLDAAGFEDPGPAAPAPGLLDPVMRWDGEDEGFVGCLGAEAGALEWERFRATGDLSDVGGFRYLYAVRRGNATQLVSVHSVGSLALEAMFPADGDAPGFDLADVPRAPGTRRTLSVRELGAPIAMTVHHAAAVDALRAHYLDALPRRGWTLAEGPRHTLHARRGGANAVLSFGEAERGAWVTVLHEEAPR